MPRVVILLCFVSVTSLCIAQQQESGPAFPTKEEIQLVVTQAERAFDQYKASVVSEADLPTAKQDKSGVEKDQQIIEMSARIINLLKQQPERFNGVFGLFLLTTLDDASRNAALCSGSGTLDIAKSLMDKPDVNAANRMLAISGKCTDVSSYLYTVSESVNALLVRNMDAQASLNEEAMKTINECRATLDSTRKKNGKR
jgi:hypothetical protein